MLFIVGDPVRVAGYVTFSISAGRWSDGQGSR